MEKVKINIHGSAVSRDVFRENASDFKIEKYIGRCSIFSLFYPAIFSEEEISDESEKNSNWEKGMLSIDFMKTFFLQIANAPSDFFVIDLIDEVFDIIKVKNNRGEESAVTLSQVLRRSSLMEKINISVEKRISTKSIPVDEIIDIIKKYSQVIKSMYKPEQIIINEAYPQEYYYDKSGKIVKFDEDRCAYIKKNRYKLKLLYAILENELYGCHIIKMENNIMCDENHQRGLDSTHFEKRFYKNVLEKIKEITCKKDSISKVSIKMSPIKNKTLDARRVLTADNIIIYGAQNYFVENFKNIDPRIKVKYLFPDGKYNSDLEKEFIILQDKEEIKKIDNAVVLIARGRAEDVKKVSGFLKDNDIFFDHLDFYTKKYITIRYLKAMGINDYIDCDNNRILFHPDIPEKLTVTRDYASDGFVEVGFTRIQTRLKIMLIGKKCFCKIGDNGSFVDTVINLNTDGKVEIGDDCMFSHSISLQQSDQHHIFDLKTKKRLNYSKNIKVGNHVWVGRQVQLLGGANIGDNCILGSRATTAGSFPPNTIIAGCPAKIIREGIIWARDYLKTSNYDIYDDCYDQTGLKYLANKEKE